ncbi:MAG: molybdate ABC transporter ATP-binding protein ModF [Congregibacter sp.]
MPPDTNQPLFELSQLGLTYRARPVLKGINWRWESGQHWAVLGPNGAGKTALATVIAGEQTHFSGRFITSDSLREGGIAYVCFERGRQLIERDQKLDCAEFESDAKDTGTRIIELLRCEPDQEAERDELVALLNMQGILDRGLRYVSTGEMRKALLVGALLSRPALLILDSPLDGLDRATQQRFRGALDQIMQRLPGVMLLCRNPSEIPDACTHTLLLDKGRVLLAGERESVLAADVARDTLAAPELLFSAPSDTGAAYTGAVPGHADDPVIDLRGVTVSFGQHCVFRDLDWRLERGQHCLVAGPNGSGKSTLLDMLTGDNHKAYGQEVYLFGQRRGSGESVWDIKARCGRVDAKMQFMVPPNNSVIAVVLSGFFDSLGLGDRPTDTQKQRARSCLNALGLGSLADHEFQTLSFGLQRIVLLARAMVKNPPILLLDEATLSLDEGHRRLLLDAVDHVVTEQECQLLFVSHTAGERPRCINQLLAFEASEDGSRVIVSDLRQS